MVGPRRSAPDARRGAPGDLQAALERERVFRRGSVHQDRRPGADSLRLAHRHHRLPASRH